MRVDGTMLCLTYSVPFLRAECATKCLRAHVFQCDKNFSLGDGPHRFIFTVISIVAWRCGLLLRAERIQATAHQFPDAGIGLIPISSYFFVRGQVL